MQAVIRLDMSSQKQGVSLGKAAAQSSNYFEVAGDADFRQFFLSLQYVAPIAFPREHPDPRRSEGQVRPDPRGSIFVST